jgi:ribosome-binding protein aMBF1 (putative translation factor)
MTRNSTDHAASTPHRTRQQNNTNNRHPGNKKEGKCVLKKELTQIYLANNRRIRRKDAWSTAATATKLNTEYDTFKLKRFTHSLMELSPS